MRTWFALLAVALALSGPAMAQPTEFSFTGQSHLRVAFGDIPLTPPTEPGSRWNAVEYHRIQHEGGNLSDLFSDPQGFVVDAATCTCGNVTFSDAGAILVRSTAEVPAGEYTVYLAYQMEELTSERHPAVVVFQPGVDGPWTASFYLRDGQTVSSRATTASDLPGVNYPEYRIQAFSGPEGSTALPVFELNSADASTMNVPGPSSDRSIWLYVAGAFLAGCIVWALLVRSGAVQKKTRKQSVAIAAHEEIATEPALVLEGKKRALMAALKEVEVAKMNAEMDTATYDVVKADLKRQTVAVMRALESSGAKKE